MSPLSIHFDGECRTFSEQSVGSPSEDGISSNEAVRSHTAPMKNSDTYDAQTCQSWGVWPGDMMLPEEFHSGNLGGRALPKEYAKPPKRVGRGRRLELVVSHQRCGWAVTET